MTGQLAAAEPYTTRFETRVTAVDGTDVRLATTYFYAESGGQPGDQGAIGGANVRDVRLDDGETVHELAPDHGLSAGQSVLCEVDWTVRMYCMRAHTASHALYGVSRDLLADLGYGGFDIAVPRPDDGRTDPADLADAKVRIDFETTTDVDDDVLVAMERRVNEAVWESREVSWESVPVETARERDDVAFNTKTEEGVFGERDEVRLVTVGPASGEDAPLDVAACGGTHVRNTREIGPVTVLERSNPGEGLTRVEFAVGTGGIRRRAAEKRAALAASDRLGTAVADLPDAVQRLREERDDLAAELADLQGELVESRVRSLAEDPVSRAGKTWVVGTVDGVGPNDLGDRAQALAGDVGDVVALVGTERPAFLVVATGGEVDAAEVVADVTDRFGGGGGGAARFAQGGGIDAAPEDVVAALRET